MNITETASAELKRVIESIEDPNTGIRIFATEGSCCGPSIQMDVANQIGVNETAVKLDGIDFFIDNTLQETLVDVTLNFNDGMFSLDGLKKEGDCNSCDHAH